MPTNTNMNHNANGYGAKLSAAIFFAAQVIKIINQFV